MRPQANWKKIISQEDYDICSIYEWRKCLTLTMEKTDLFGSSLISGQEIQKIICVQEVYWQVLFALAPVGEWRKHRGRGRSWAVDTITTKAQPTLWGALELEQAFRAGSRGVRPLYLALLTPARRGDLEQNSSPQPMAIPERDWQLRVVYRQHSW